MNLELAIDSALKEIKEAADKQEIEAKADHLESVSIHTNILVDTAKKIFSRNPFIVDLLTIHDLEDGTVPPFVDNEEAIVAAELEFSGHKFWFYHEYMDRHSGLRLCMAQDNKAFFDQDDEQSELHILKRIHEYQGPVVEPGPPPAIKPRYYVRSCAVENSEIECELNRAEKLGYLPFFLKVVEDDNEGESYFLFVARRAE